MRLILFRRRYWLCAYRRSHPSCDWLMTHAGIAQEATKERSRRNCGMRCKSAVDEWLGCCRIESENLSTCRPHYRFTGQSVWYRSGQQQAGPLLQRASGCFGSQYSGMQDEYPAVYVQGERRTNVTLPDQRSRSLLLHQCCSGSRSRNWYVRAHSTDESLHLLKHVLGWIFGLVLLQHMHNKFYAPVQLVSGHRALWPLYQGTEILVVVS